MKLHISEIHSHGLEITADAKTDRWFEESVRDSFLESFPVGNEACLSIRLVRTCENVALGGLVEVDLSPSCSRCLEPFQKHLAIPLHLNLAPYPKHDVLSEEPEAADDDVGFAYYKGEELDLKALLHETLLLEVPFKYLCAESCKGLCPHCGKNLNTVPCTCPAEAPKGPFTILEKLKK